MTFIRGILAALALSVSVVGMPTVAEASPQTAVVKIRSSAGVGSGFIFDKGPSQTYILTVGHVVRGDPAPELEFGAALGSEATASIYNVYRRTQDDDSIVVLSVPSSLVPANATSLPFDFDLPELGDSLTVVGYPAAIDYIATANGSLFARRTSDLVFSARLDEGFSGSPVISNGRVVGIVIAAAAYDRALAASIASVEAMLRGDGLVRRRLTANFLGAFGGEGTAPGKFEHPWGIGTTFSSDYVYVAGWKDNRVQYFSSNGSYRGTLKVPGAETTWGSFLTVDSNGILHAVSDRWRSGGVTIESFYGGNENYIGSTSIQSSGLRAIDTDIYGKLFYVADISTDQILVFDDTGRRVGIWGREGTGPGEFRDPWGIAVDRYVNRRVYVADTGNNRVQVFEKHGAFVAAWGDRGRQAGQFDSPIDIAVNYQTGDVYVLDSGNARVQIISSEGAVLGMFGRKGNGPGEFLDPVGISVDGRGVVYVADTGNHRVQYFTIVEEY